MTSVSIEVIQLEGGCLLYSKEHRGEERKREGDYDTAIMYVRIETGTNSDTADIQLVRANTSLVKHKYNTLFDDSRVLYTHIGREREVYT